MTDKQIIIDGVDVSGCEFLIINKDRQMCRCIKSDLFGGIEFVENAKKGNCKDNPNCYYKQLKAKEQECEELKSYYELHAQEQMLIKKIHTIVNSHPNYGIELTENGYLDKDERLSYLELDKQIELIFKEQKQQLDQLKAENEILKEKLVISSNSDKKTFKIIQTLTEIKEIAITGLEGFCPKCSRKECEDNNCIETAIRDILQKISEVIPNEKV